MMRYFILIILFVAGCLQNTQVEQKYFHYQLQNASFPNLNELSEKIIIIDPDDANLTKEQIEKLKEKKIVLAYLSIGEAEDYRDYWTEIQNSDFIEEENPKWKGNYKVEYWNLEWQNIILKKVEDISKEGYSGVYLDIIDAYEYFEENNEVNTAEEMIIFVKKINEKGMENNQNFLTFPQNGISLYKDLEYKKNIDGIGKEDTWYEDNNEKDEEDIKILDQALKNGEMILAIDYPTEKEEICDFYKQCKSKGFYCTVSNRELNLNKRIEC